MPEPFTLCSPFLSGGEPLFLWVVLFLVFSPLFFSIFMNRSRILCWDCRGIAARVTSTGVMNFIRQLKPVMVCLVETRTNDAKVNHFSARLPRSWAWAGFLSDIYSGGILVLWNKILDYVTPIDVSRRALHLIVSPNILMRLVIFVIYIFSCFHYQLPLVCAF